MVIVIEHHQKDEQGTITELHCGENVAQSVARAIHQVTGEHPVAVPIMPAAGPFQAQVAFFVKTLNLEEACALLRMITLYGEAPENITRDLIAGEIAVEEFERKRGSSRIDLTPNECCCRKCQDIRRMETQWAQLRQMHEWDRLFQTPPANERDQLG